METKSTCPYCGVGCGVLIEHDGAQITSVRGDPDHPANFGRLCTKGSTLHLTATPVVVQGQRLRQVLHRPRGGVATQAVGWDEANTRIAQELLRIRAAHGPSSIGFYISGQLLTEDYYAFNKLARAVIGYKQSLGADAPPCSYEDIEQADCILITGANPAWAHPVLFRRLEDGRARRPGQKLIVVDPRRTETAELADLHLQIQPGTDVALMHGLLHACIWQGWVKADYVDAHTEGFAALKDLVREWTPARAAKTCGIEEAAIWQAAAWFATAPAALSLYCQGLNQSSSGTAKNTSLINLHLATGQIGRPGAGPFSLTGQPNAMGGRESGGMATLLPGHRDPGNADHRAEVARLWGLGTGESLPSGPGYTATALFEAAARGEIKALWIACTNPAQSLPNQALVREALQRCELVILQEAFANTATSAYADWQLPAATWGEKEGTVTNSERRISRVRAAVPPPAEARPDWHIVAGVALQLEAALRPGRTPLFQDASPEQLWNEHRATTAGRDLDITGLSYPLLDHAGPQQWPFPQGAAQGQPRLYADGRFPTPSGRARFIASPYRPPAEAPSAQFPLALTTGRLRDQWHGMSRSGSVPQLFAHEAAPVLRLNPQDAARRRLAEGELLTLRTRRGELVLPLQLDARVAPAQADLAMHWGEEFIGGAGQRGINALTQDRSCPDSRQPELKFSALAVESAQLPWRVSACAWVPAAEGAALRQRLRALMPAFAYAQCLPVPGNDPALQGWAFEAAHGSAPDPALLQQLADAAGLGGPGVHRYADAGRGRLRLLRLDGARLQALLRAGEHEEAAWLLPLWRERQDVAALGRWLLSPGSPPHEALGPVRAPQVCNCLDVREDAITTALGTCSGSDAERLAQLQGQLRCGTQCGSCLPTLRRLVREVPEKVPA